MRGLLTCASAILWTVLLCSEIAESSQPYLSMTACDSLTIGGQQFTRATFGITNGDEHVTHAIIMHPKPIQIPSDTCHVLSVTAPAGWAGGILFDGGAQWQPETPDDLLGLNESITGFQVVLSRPMCRYRVSIWTDIFSVPYAVFDVDFGCSQPTPVALFSWGQLKHHYR